MQKYGKLKIFHIKGQKAFCVCDCGNFCLKLFTNIKIGHTSSCGCKSRERGRQALEQMRLKNNNTPYKTDLNRLYRKYKYQAEQKGLTFQIKKDVFYNLTQQLCFYCDSAPGSYIRKESGFLYNGLDRVDSSCGYVIENVVPCCGKCNIAKNSLTIHDFIYWVERFVQHNDMIEDFENNFCKEGSE